MLLLLVVGIAAMNIQHSQPQANHTWAAVIVEPFYSRMVVESLINVRYHIHKSIPIYVVTSDADRALFETIQTTFDLQIKPINFAKSASSGSYSKLLTSSEFWNLFKEEYILIFQADSRFCMGTKRHIRDFVGRYEYIGTPWSARSGDLRELGHCVGNGGFSLRNRTAMLDCCEWLKSKHMTNGGNEDILFVRCLLALKYRLPSCDEALAFAVESYYNKSIYPMAMHQANRLLPGHVFFAHHCPEAMFLFTKER